MNLRCSGLALSRPVLADGKVMPVFSCSGGWFRAAIARPCAGRNINQQDGKTLDLIGESNHPSRIGPAMAPH